MEICIDCDIEDKLRICCGMHPLTMESTGLLLNNGSIAKACPSLNEYGLCIVYDSRPGICKRFVCPEVNKLDMYSSLG